MAMTPDFTVNACLSSGFWKKVGAAWKNKAKNGKSFISIKVETLPIPFDGRLTLYPYELHPYDEDEQSDRIEEREDAVKPYHGRIAPPEGIKGHD